MSLGFFFKDLILFFKLITIGVQWLYNVVSLCVCLVTQLCPTLCNPWTAACQAALSMGILQAGILEWTGPPGDLTNPGTEPRSPTWQADSLLSEPPGKPKSTRVGNLSLLQGGIFPTQELNQGLLHCRWILYQLSHQGGRFYCTACWWECKLIAVIMENSMEVP